MQINKVLFWFSLIISIVLIIIASTIEFSTDIKILKFVENIILNVFAGTIVLIATSAFEYNVQKRRNIISMQEKIIEIEQQFDKIEYMKDIEEYPTYEQYVSYYKNNNLPVRIGKEQYEEGKQNELNVKYKKDFENIIDEYIKISSINLNELWRIYDDLHFMWPPFYKDKKKIKIYKELFEYIKKHIKAIKISAFYFEEYKKNNNPNYKEAYKILLNTQKNIFYHEKTYGYITDWLDSHDENFITSNGQSAIDDSYTIEYNLVSEYLDKKWKELGKL